jgi:excisionase family DNA binding protein
LRKKDLVAGLVTRYLDPETGLGPVATQRKPLDTRDGDVMLGSYSFQPYDPPEIMNAEQAGQFLQIDEKMVIELAEAGKIPGKKLGPVWRFSREALVAWLSTPEKR